MKIYSPNITTVIKSIQGKKFLAECKPHHFNDKPLKLSPITDIDDEFVSYSIGNPGESITFPTNLSDVFEKMSFEKAANKNYPDIFRENELYRHSTDYRPDACLVLDTDDVPLSPTILKEVYHHGDLSKVYYPDTDFNYDSQVVLKHMDFSERIIPSAFDPKLHVEKNVIKQYADIATRAWKNDVPPTKIIELIKKSIVNGNDIAITYPSATLFEFLTKYPNERKLAVFSSTSGVEHLDEAAMQYFDKFTTKYFKDKNLIRSILEECKTKQEYPTRTVNAKLCEIATLTRKKSAHGMETPNYRYVSLDGTRSSMYCDMTTPWRECDSKLIEALKKDGKLDEEKYEIARQLLKVMNKSVDYVLENLGGTIDKSKQIHDINTALEKKWHFSYSKGRQDIAKHLDEQLKNLLAGEQNSLSNDIACVNTLNEKDIVPSQIWQAVKTLSNSFKGDETTQNEIINAVLVPANKKGTRLEVDKDALCLVRRLLFRGEDTLDAKGHELINLINDSMPSDKKEVIGRIDMLLDEMNYKDVTADMVKKAMSKAPEKVSPVKTEEVATSPNQPTKERAIKIKQGIMSVQELKQEGKLPEEDGNFDYDEIYAKLHKIIADIDKKLSESTGDATQDIADAFNKHLKK